MKHNSTFFKPVVTQSSCFSDRTQIWPRFSFLPGILRPTCCVEKQAGIQNTIHVSSGEFKCLMIVEMFFQSRFSP